jgi:hypothetical protein
VELEGLTELRYPTPDVDLGSADRVASKQLASLRGSNQSHLMAVLRCAEWWLVAYEWVRFLALVFEHSTSIASIHIIHGCPFHTLIAPIFTQKYFTSPNLRILCSERLFIESGMHEHSFALNLVLITQSDLVSPAIH